MTERPTPITDALVQQGPFSGPKEWIALWDKAIDSHRQLERELSEAREMYAKEAHAKLVLQEVLSEAREKLERRDALLRWARLKIAWIEGYAREAKMSAIYEMTTDLEKGFQKELG